MVLSQNVLQAIRLGKVVFLLRLNVNKIDDSTAGIYRTYAVNIYYALVYSLFDFSFAPIDSGLDAYKMGVN